MIFIINSEGTTTSAIYEAVYQGNNNANRVVLLAPFASTSQTTVAFKLPNGHISKAYTMELLQGFDQAVSEVLAEGKSLNAWYISIDSPITQYAGIVDVQFTIYTGNGKVQNTYPSSFEVIFKLPEGELPEAPDADIYKQILDHLATLATNSEGTDEKAISYIRYKAPSEYLLNGADATDVTVSTAPEGVLLAYLSDFTLSGMTAYLDEDNLKNPALSGNSGNRFLQFMPSQPENSGFIIDLGSVKAVGIVQPYIYNISHDTTLEAYASVDGKSYVLMDSVSIDRANIQNALSAIQLRINSSVRYVKIIETCEAFLSGNIVFKGVEVYATNKKGYYEIKQNNGATSYIADSVSYAVGAGNATYANNARNATYATNAGNATYATSAGNATHINGHIINKITQEEYDNLADKTGIYFVTVGE